MCISNEILFCALPFPFCLNDLFERHQLNNELEEVKKVCDDEAKERQSLMGR